MSVLLLAPGVGPDKPEWHAVRRQGIGASEIAAVLGLSPWESPFSLWWRKREGWQVEATGEMGTGTRLEPVVADWWADEDGHRRAVHPAGVYAHPDRRWQTASPDRLVCDGQMHDNPFPGGMEWAHPDVNTVAVLECKWTARWDGWGEPGGDDIPVYYRTQVLWQCDVMGVDQWHVAVLGPGGFRAYQGRRDDVDLAVMVAAGEEFMQRLEAGDPPPLDWREATTATLKRLHPSVVEGKEVEVPADLAAEYDDARAAATDAEHRKKLATHQLLDLIGDGHRAICEGQRVATRSLRKPTVRLDRERLKKELPDVYARYVIESDEDSTPVLTPARRKKES